MNDVRLGSHSLVANSIIGKNTMIGSHFIAEQTKLAMPFLDGELHHVMNLGAIIGENCRFGHGILVEAGKSLVYTAPWNPPRRLERTSTTIALSFEARCGHGSLS